MKNDIAKILLLGQYGPQKYVTKQEIQHFDLCKIINYTQEHFHSLSMNNLAYIMKGIYTVYLM
jgi:hypothetical protein